MLPTPMIYAGSAPNTAPVVRIFNLENGFLSSTDIAVAASSFTGGVRVAAADFTGDGVPDIVTALGAGGLPKIRVFDALTLKPVAGPLGSFQAFEATFGGGVTVATADVDGDGVADIIAGAGSGGGPRVRVFSGADGTELESFFAFETTFTGGVNVAAADLTGDGKSELIVGAGTGGGPRVRVFDPVTDSPLAGPLGSFFAFDAGRFDGVSVGSNFWAGDVDADGTPDLAVGTQAGLQSRVKVYSGAGGAVLSDFAPFDTTIPGSAVSVSLAYIDDDALADVVVGQQWPKGAVRVFAGATGVPAGGFGDFKPFGNVAGITIAGGNDPHPAWVEPAVPPEVSLTAPDATASEAGVSTGVFVFTRTGTTDNPLTVSYTIYAVASQPEATEGALGDYQLRSWPANEVLSGEVVFLAGEGNVAVRVQPRDDEAIEGNEWVHVAVADAPAGEYTIDAVANKAAVVIVDDDGVSGPSTTDDGAGGTTPPGGGTPVNDGPPTVLLTADDPTAAEAGESTGLFRVTRLGVSGAVPTNPVTVYYAVSGTATPGDDYVPLGGVVTIPAGAVSTTFRVLPIDDDLAEGTETVVVTLLDGGTAYTLVQNFVSATVNIADNDKPTFDLDVNANGSLKDAVDLAERYLPGYEGKVAKVSTGNSFNTAKYTGQKMKLILDGVGTGTKGITKVAFLSNLTSTTSWPGYASNGKAVEVTGSNKERDYSFSPSVDSDYVLVSKTKTSSDPVLDNTVGIGGEMEGDKTWAYFWAKDYGGYTGATAIVYALDENGIEQPSVYQLQIPKDMNGDKVADKWQLEMVTRWVTQYGTSPLGAFATIAQAMAALAPGSDGEWKDPDGAGTNYVPQAEEGDRHTVLEEYRGFILDGGGFDGGGVNGSPRWAHAS